MPYLRRIILLLLVLMCSTSLYAGFIKSFRSINILSQNYGYYLPSQKPDSAVAYFINSVWTDPWKINYWKSNEGNKIVIDSFIGVQKILFFRCFYKNALGIVYKYIDVAIKGETLAEGIKADAATNNIEFSRYYKSGSLLSRYMLVQQFTREEETSRNSISGARLTHDSLWYNLKPEFVKQGIEKVYYENGALRIERRYNANILADSTYTEYFNNGIVRKVYEIHNGKIDGELKKYNEQGKLVSSIAYKKGDKVESLLKSDKTNVTLKAFLFGLDSYSPFSGERWADSSARYIDLKSCVNDVNLLTGALVKGQDFAENNITKITNDYATREGVLSAFELFIGTLNKGDIAFIHFSGHGTYRYKDEENKKDPELLIPCRDVYQASKNRFDKGYIKQDELQSFFNSIKSKLGFAGQLYISMDVSHSGYFIPDNEKDAENSNVKQSSFRGESNNMLINLARQPGAPIFIYTATSKDQFGMESRDENNKAYGTYSYKMAKILMNPIILNTGEFYESIKDSVMAAVSNRQSPQYFATENQFLFESTARASNNSVSLPIIIPSGKSFVVSVGISDYVSSKKSNLRFQNATADASAYSAYFAQKFSELGVNNLQSFTGKELLNRTACKDSILAAINMAISNTHPEDYFIFNFSGYCKPLPDSLGKMVTYFVPHGLKDISDDKEIRKEGISLTQLKDLLQLIPANNQLFITEAGSTADFQREFIQALMETSPSLAALSNKNRIFIIPKNSGLDNYNCKNRVIEHGPINYYVTNLNDGLNIFGLFERGLYADAIKFALAKSETDCDYFRTSYFDIFFEKDFVSDLKYFLPEEVMQSRGIGIIQKEKEVMASFVGKKYALVVGTDNYTGKPDWKNLANPVYDAREVAGLLKNNFGYETILLEDASADTVYKHILQLSATLAKNDQLIVYMAGHGDYDETLFDDGFLVCSNSKPLAADPYRNSYIQYSKLSRMINKLPAQQILMVLDVCFGGTFDERVARNTGRNKEDSYKDIGSEKFFIEKMKKKTRLYLTSGGKKEVPDGYKGKHSPFAVRLMQALGGKGGAAGILTASDLFQFVQKLPSGPMIGSFGDDELGSEFVMMAK